MSRHRRPVLVRIANEMLPALIPRPLHIQLLRDRVHKLIIRRPGHPLRKMLIQHFVEHFPSASTLKPRIAKRALPHLLQQRPVERLRHKPLRFLLQLLHAACRRLGNMD